MFLIKELFCPEIPIFLEVKQTSDGNWLNKERVQVLRDDKMAKFFKTNRNF